MTDLLRYEISTAPVRLETYRADVAPAPGLGLCGLWPGCVVEGESGRRYFFMLSIGSRDPDRVHFSDLEVITPGTLDTCAPQLVPEYGGSSHPFTMAVDDERIVYEMGPACGHLEFTTSGYDWTAVDGRVRLHCELAGDAVTYWIPEQDGLTEPVHHQSQTGLVTGTVDDDPVVGFSLLDIAWARPGRTWFDIEIFRDIQKEWTMWLVEYEGGRIDGGYAWLAKPGWGFAAGHLILDGTSSANQRAVTELTFAKCGVPEKVRIEQGDHWIELEYDAMADWPLHPLGHAVASSVGLPIRRSWSMTEWVPDNVKALIDDTGAPLHFASRRLVPSVVVDGELVPASGDHS